MSSLSPSKSKSPPRENNSRFLVGLNAQQREAVQVQGAPVLILAGAGTGKTRVIAHRIAHLLEVHPDWTPAHLLALTFSRKAAQEMLVRVEALLGATADSLQVSTFHSFCHRFLEMHAVALGLPVRFRLLDATEAWIFFRTLLRELKLSVYWNLSDPTGSIDGFARFISRAKDELITPEAYATYADGLTDPRQRRGAQEVARVYRIYQTRMREAGNLDFGDLIVETLKALTTHPKLLEELQAIYRSILVDEFQDTNVAQIELLKALAGTSGELCVVGDDDQAIYRFRGASFASFILMKESFSDVQTIRLSQNYRSTKNILSLVERLIRNNEPDRYDPQKRLWTDGETGVPVEVQVVQEGRHEAQAVAERIKALYKEQPAQERSYGRIAVLYRAHAHRELLVEQLGALKIPFVVRGGAALFKELAIKDLISFLKILHNPKESVELFRLLGHPVWGIPVEDLLTLSRSAREKQISIWEFLNLKRSEPLALSQETEKSILDFVTQVNQIRKGIIRSSIVEIVEQISERTFMRTVLRLPPTESSDPWMNLGRFLRFVHRYASTHREAQDLDSFLWYLDSAQRAGYRDSVEEDDTTLSDRVRLMTVHQAKGLEFDWVILLGMTQGRFPSRARPEPIPFPVELMKESLPKGDWHLQEERRLCYVACTRARKGLTLFTQDRAYHRSSVFVREMLAEAPQEEIVKQLLESDSQEGGGLLERPAGSLAAEREVIDLFQKIRSLDPRDEAEFTSALRRVTQLAGSMRGLAHRATEKSGVQFPIPERFSYTQLESYRYCPLKYLYSYIYRIPIKTTPEMAFGVDLHEVLERFFLEVMKGTVPSLKQLLDSFQQLYTPGRYGEPIQEQIYRKLGGELLTAFYKKQGEQFPVPLSVERSFTLELGEGVRIKGVMDRIDPLGEGVEILDYKSGKPKEKASKEDQLQLRLYALACKEVFALEPKRVSFYYLRDNSKLSYEQQPEALEETRERILELANQIRSGNYTATPTVMKCRRCDFKTLCPESKA